MSTDDKARNNSVRRVVRSLAKSISEECNQPVKYTEALRIWNTLGVEVTKSKNDTSPVEDSESIEGHVVNDSEVTEPKTIDLRKLTDTEFAEAVTDLGAAVIPVSNNSDEPDVYDPLDTAKVQAVDGKVEKDDVDYLGQVVAVTSSKGGVGKATIAITLASYLAYASKAAFDEGESSRPLKVVVVDLDVKNGQLGFMMNAVSPTILNLYSEGISNETLKDNLIYSPTSKFDFLLAPKRGLSAEDFPIPFYEALIRALQERYDYVILNTSVDCLSDLTKKAAYPMANQIVYVTDSAANSVLSMGRWVREATLSKEKGGLGVDQKKIGIIINKAIAHVGMPDERIARAARKTPIIATIPAEQKLFLSAMNSHNPNLVLNHQDVKNGIKKLAKSIVSSKHPLSENFDTPRTESISNEDEFSMFDSNFTKPFQALESEVYLGEDSLPLGNKESIMTEDSRPKAIFIGTKILSEIVAKENPQWNFQKREETILEFWQGLNDGRISVDLEAVFINGKLFDKSGHYKEFEQIVAYLAPHCFVGILSYSSKAQEDIKARVKFESFKLGNEKNLDYHFINLYKVKTSTEEKYAEYLANKSIQ